jgi:hypothetical protein
VDVLVHAAVLIERAQGALELPDGGQAPRVREPHGVDAAQAVHQAG